ncbi:hypothetical protein HPB52_011700 [Rhipicephalus sanguineus]|uniref:Uncharacterized protein n=1 Tax=Rhipicephalus sanguineus TaxID=34632 RepID=A0A9D4PGD3_RHISA|nr:hypothetical protein HPB52_011700 [Rhipicephalus sanguineus]
MLQATRVRFAPIIRYKSLRHSLYSGTDESESEVVSGRQQGCDCGHCVVLDNFGEEECLCCREMGDPVTAVQPEGCITEHPEFHLVSHRRAPCCVLRTVR